MASCRHLLHHPQPSGPPFCHGDKDPLSAHRQFSGTPENARRAPCSPVPPTHSGHTSPGLRGTDALSFSLGQSSIVTTLSPGSKGHRPSVWGSTLDHLVLAHRSSTFPSSPPDHPSQDPKSVDEPWCQGKGLLHTRALLPAKPPRTAPAALATALPLHSHGPEGTTAVHRPLGKPLTPRDGYRWASGRARSKSALPSGLQRTTSLGWPRLTLGRREVWKG